MKPYLKDRNLVKLKLLALNLDFEYNYL